MGATGTCNANKPDAEKPAANKPLYTFAQVQERVKEGRALLIYDNGVYDVTSWKSRHPGGELIIEHMIGRDATDQILTNHSHRVVERTLKCFQVGMLGDDDKDRGVLFDRPLSLDFRKLHRRMYDEGLFATRPTYYARLFFCIYSLLIAAVAVLYNYSDSWTGVAVSSVLMSLFWHQSHGVMHDAGHNAVTKKRSIDHLIATLFTNVHTGFAAGWWKATHFLHHLMTNDPEHDPHIQLMPFIAITTRFFRDVYSSFYHKLFSFDAVAKIMVPIQHITYLPLMCVARFVVYKDGILYTLLRRPYLWQVEAAALVLYWTYFLTLVSWIGDWRMKAFYFFFTNALLIILQLQLFVSHNAMSTIPMAVDEDFVTYQLRTTLDYHCDEWMDWFNGGLQFQVAHHFFPRIPRHNLRRATQIVLEFIKERNLEYNIMSFTGGNVKLLSHLKAIALEAVHLINSAKQQTELLSKATHGFCANGYSKKEE